MTKRALLVGINEFQYPQFNLRGCVNDTNSLNGLLQTKFGFEDSQVKTLINGQATRANILTSLKSLIDASEEGDVLIFGVSSHETQVGNGVPGEEDGKNEAIVPWEAKYSSLIKDDDLYQIISSRGEEHLSKIGFTGIYDTCHPGTMIRTFKVIDDDFYWSDTINRCIFIEDLMDLEVRAATLGPYTSLSACLDNQTAADLRVEGEFRGAFSYALHKVIASDPTIKVEDLEPRVLELITGISSHQQTPKYFEGKDNARIFAMP